MMGDIVRGKDFALTETKKELGYEDFEFDNGNGSPQFNSYVCGKGTRSFHSIF